MSNQINLFVGASVKPAAVTNPERFLAQWSPFLVTQAWASAALASTDAPADKLVSIRKGALAFLREQTKEIQRAADEVKAVVGEAKRVAKPKGLDTTKPFVKVFDSAGNMVLEKNVEAHSKGVDLAARRLVEMESGSTAIVTFTVCDKQFHTNMNRDEAFAIMLGQDPKTVQFGRKNTGSLEQPWMRAPKTTKVGRSHG